MEMHDNPREYAKKFIDDEEFNALLDENITAVEAQFVEPRQSYFPQILAYSLKEKDQRKLAMIMMDIDFQEKEKTNMAFEGAGVKLAEERYYPVAFYSSEIWYRTVNHMSEHQGRVSDYDDKKEAIMLWGRTFEGRYNCCRWDIVRDEKNNMRLTNKTKDYFNGHSNTTNCNYLNLFFKGHIMAAASKAGLPVVD